MASRRILVMAVLACLSCTCTTIEFENPAASRVSVTPPASNREIPRLNAVSPEYYVAEEDVGFYINYSGWDPDGGALGTGQRFTVFQMRDKIADMVARADRFVILAVFLFDNVYSEGELMRDMARELATLLVEKKQQRPDITIAVILDDSHRAYGRRVSSAERAFRKAGIDVFYSDLIGGLKYGRFPGLFEASAHVSRILHRATGNVWGMAGATLLAWLRVPGPFNIDGEAISLEMLYNS